MSAAAKTSSGDQRRKAELAKIHVGKKRLGLTDPEYRSIVARVSGGKTSSADLEQGEQSRLLDEFKRLGFREGNTYTKKLADLTDREPQARLIKCLWADCAAAGIMRESSDAALRRFVKRATGRDALEWLTAIDANKVIEGLKR